MIKPKQTIFDSGITEEYETFLKNTLNECKNGKKSLVKELTLKKEFRNPESLHVNFNFLK
jgi:hypothetical protein